MLPNNRKTKNGRIAPAPESRLVFFEWKSAKSMFLQMFSNLEFYPNNETMININSTLLSNLYIFFELETNYNHLFLLI